MGVHAFICWCWSDNAWPFDKVNAPTGLEGMWDHIDPWNLEDDPADDFKFFNEEGDYIGPDESNVNLGG